jgi:hypothetical protein
MNIKVTIEKEIGRDIVENIFVTALEGGSNDWYWLTDETVAKVRKYVSRKDESALSVAIFKAVMDHGVVVQIHDKETVGEDDDVPELLGELNMNTVKERLQLLASNKDYSYALDQELNETGDAITSDVVFQFLVMGECIFS